MYSYLVRLRNLLYPFQSSQINNKNTNSIQIVKQTLKLLGNLQYQYDQKHEDQAAILRTIERKKEQCTRKIAEESKQNGLQKKSDAVVDISKL